MTVTIADVRHAAAAIAGEVVATPLDHSEVLSKILGAEIYLKLENMQYTAAFKERGALNRLKALSAEERAAGVIAMSAGNHAQAVAHHATRLGIQVTIVMPRTTPFLKIANTETLGARVELEGETLEEASAFADAEAAARGLVFIHPYDDPLVIAGQGTVALEMLEAAPDLETLIVPVGGGGLISGCAVAAKALAPGIEVIGVQAALCPAMQAELEGRPCPPGGLTLADGIAVKRPGRITRAIVAEKVDDIVLVEEGQIEHAIMLMAEIEKVVVEGAGAVALAAVIADPARFAGRRVGIVISGGNIDSRLLASVLMRGLVRSGRLVRLRIELSDAPGRLADVTGRIGALGANIVEVVHQRWFHDIPARLTEIDVILEVRSSEDAEEVVAALRDAGYRVARRELTSGGG